MTPPPKPPFPVMPAKAGIHNFTIHAHARTVMTVLLRVRARAEGIL
jgi:hypothetical protein